MRYGIIGTGYSFRGHLATLKILPGCEVTAVCDRDPRRLAEAAKLVGPRCLTFDSARALAASDAVDLVIISTPNNTHYEIAKEVLPSGKHVLCEKPMGTTVAQARELLELSATSKGKLFIGLEFRCNDFFVKIGDLLKAGKVGTPRFFWIKEYRGFFQSGTDNWRLSQATGGTFLEKNIHHFDLLNWYAGAAPASVAAVKANAFHPEVPIADEGMVIVKYVNGCLANLNVCLHGPWKSASGSHQEFGIIGNRGMLEAFLDLRRIVYTPEQGEQEVIELGPNPNQDKYRVLEGYRPDYDGWYCYLYPEHEGILAALAGKPSNAATAQTGYEGTRLALAAEEAAASGETVRL